MSHAFLGHADLSESNLSEAVLDGAFLFNANLDRTDVSGSRLNGATLERAILIQTNFSNADLSGCSVYGISAWSADLTGAKQDDLVITGQMEPVVTVDNLEVAQFVYLLLHNEKIRDVIDTITTKAVLILGRFTEERKAVLDAIREELRRRDYVPILFDFQKPDNRDLTETLMTLAGMARFVIADLSDPHSIPHELMAIVERLPSVPVQPIFCAVEAHPEPYSMFEHFRNYRHVLPIHEYSDDADLLSVLGEKVVEPAETMVAKIRNT